MDATLPYRPVHNIPKTVSAGNYEMVNTGNYETVNVGNYETVNVGNYETVNAGNCKRESFVHRITQNFN